MSEGTVEGYTTRQCHRSSHKPTTSQNRRTFRSQADSHDPRSWIRAAGGTVRRLWPRHVRSRMTLWYVLVLGVLLLAYAVVASSYLFFSLREQLDHDLLEDSERVEGRLENSPNGMVTLGSVHHGEDEPDMQRFGEFCPADDGLLFLSPPL